jgi:hypothetical protein
VAIAIAPPDFSRIPPKIAPNPTTVATNPRVDPIPFSTVAITSVPDKPPRIPITMLAINNAINAVSFKKSI